MGTDNKALPDYADILARHVRGNPFSKLLPIEAAELRPGYARAVLPVGENLRDSQGAVHNGVLFALADVAGGSAAACHGEWVATLCADFHYLRPGLNTTALTAVAREVKHGKRACVCQVEVMGEDGSPLACGTFTFSRLGKPIEL